MKTNFKSFNEGRKYKIQYPISTGSGVEFGDVNQEVELKKLAIVGEIFELDSVSGYIDKDHYELDFGHSLAGGMDVILHTWGDREMEVVGRNFFGDIYQGTDKWYCTAVIGGGLFGENDEVTLKFDYFPKTKSKKKNINDPYGEEEWGEDCDFEQFEANIKKLKRDAG